MGGAIPFMEELVVKLDLAFSKDKFNFLRIKSLLVFHIPLAFSASLPNSKLSLEQFPAERMVFRQSLLLMKGQNAAQTFGLRSKTQGGIQREQLLVVLRNEFSFS